MKITGLYFMLSSMERRGQVARNKTQTDVTNKKQTKKHGLRPVVYVLFMTPPLPHPQHRSPHTSPSVAYPHSTLCLLHICHTKQSANMEKGEHKEEPPAQTEEEAKNEEKEEEKKEEPKKAQEEEKIRSIVLTGYGGYSKVQIQKSIKPQPTDGRVVVRVHAW